MSKPLMRDVIGRSGSSLMREPEIEALCNLLTSQLLQSTTMLEVGSYEGVTASVIAERCPQSTIVSIDPFMEHDEFDVGRRHGPDRIANWLRNKRRNQHLWTGTLRDFYSFSNCNFNVVLIDGGHDYNSVRSDLAYASTMIFPDSVIAVHDYQECDGISWAGVTKATDDFIGEHLFVISEIVESLALLRKVASK